MAHAQEYLSEKAAPRVSLDDDGLCSKRLLFKIRTEPPDPDWFDEVAGEGTTLSAVFAPQVLLEVEEKPGLWIRVK